MKTLPCSTALEIYSVCLMDHWIKNLSKLSIEQKLWGKIGLIFFFLKNSDGLMKCFQIK